MNSIFYIVISMLAMLSITFEELSTKHQAAWNIYHKDLDSAEKLFNDALIEYRSYLDIRREAVALIDLATVNAKRGNQIGQLRFLLKAENLVTQFEDSSLTFQLYGFLFNAYKSVNDMEKAITYLNKRKGYLQLSDSISVFAFYDDLISAYLDLDMKDSAKHYLDIAYNSISFGNIEKKTFLDMYGYYFYRFNQLDSALYYYKKSMDYYDKWKNNNDLNATLNYYSIRQEAYGDVSIKTVDSLLYIIDEAKQPSDVAQLLALKSNITKDTNYIHRAISIAKGLGDKFFELNLLKELGDLQFKLKHYDYAKRNTELYHRIKDSTALQKSNDMMAQLSQLDEGTQLFKENKDSDKIYLLLALIIIVSLLAYIIFTKFSTYRRKK